MMSDDAYYDHLLTRYLNNQCTPTELEELLSFLEEDSSNQFLLRQLKEKIHQKSISNKQITEDQSARIRENLLNNIEAPAIRMRKKWIWTAAAVLIFFAAGSWYASFQTSNKNPSITKTVIKNKVLNDVLPGAEKATLTLADGSTMVLDTAHNGELASQGNTTLLKINNKVAYNASGANNAEILYNTISTPRGGQYHIELPDGTQVWLNAASSIYFPTAFPTSERRVQVTGEVYFEVSENKAKPFFVSINNAEIQVLGTHFNVMGYDEEASLNTTLLEGSVRFTSGGHSSVLKPGQQSQLTKDGAMKLDRDIDVEEVIAWKNGSFHFENAALPTVLRQLSRWYDVDVVYKNKNEGELLHADIPRNTKLSDALKVLELASGEKFRIEQRKIIVDK